MRHSKNRTSICPDQHSSPFAPHRSTPVRAAPSATNGSRCGGPELICDDRHQPKPAPLRPVLARGPQLVSRGECKYCPLFAYSAREADQLRFGHVPARAAIRDRQPVRPFRHNKESDRERPLALPVFVLATRFPPLLRPPKNRSRGILSARVLLQLAHRSVQACSPIQSSLFFATHGRAPAVPPSIFRTRQHR